MKVSREFLKDFATCANFYGWGEAKIESVKAEIRADPRRVAHWQRQAALVREEQEPPSLVEVDANVRENCMSCARFSLRHAPKEEVEKGYGRCLAHPVDVLMHISRDVKCRDYRTAPADRVEARRVWYAQQRTKL
jgi:hypothetical protein